jgi:hypothetical protein
VALTVLDDGRARQASPGDVAMARLVPPALSPGLLLGSSRRQHRQLIVVEIRLPTLSIDCLPSALAVRVSHEAPRLLFGHPLIGCA